MTTAKTRHRQAGQVDRRQWLAASAAAVVAAGMPRDSSPRRWDWPRWLWRALWTPALAWCAISAATLWTMDSAQAWVVPAAALASVTAAGPRMRYPAS